MANKLPIKTPDGLGLEVLEIKDRIYRYKKGTPLAYYLKSKSSKSSPLLYFDESTGVNHEIRYARNQNTPFVSCQDDNVILDHVVFIDGMLTVPKSNMALQYFLAIHPLNNFEFEEIDKDKDAEKELKIFDLRSQADDLAVAIGKDVDAMEELYMELFKRSARNLKNSEMRRDIRVEAMNNPKRFIQIANNFSNELAPTVRSFISDNLIQFRRDNTQMWYNLPNNKKKIIDIPQGVDHMEAALNFFETEEGLQAVREIEKIQATI